MKKALIIIISLILNSESISSQDNPGFENWLAPVTSGTNTYQEPVSWQTFNFLVPFGNPVSVFRVGGTDKYSGNYALKVKTVFFTNKLGVITFPDSIGLVFNGKIIFSPPSYKIGSPYTTRSEKFSFYAKYSPVGNDTGMVVVTLHKKSSTGRDTIATGQINVNAIGSYSLFQITLNYRSNGTPDTAAIAFASSKTKASTRVGSEIFIDDVAFSGSVPIGIKENNAYSSKINLFPNPSNNLVTINSTFDDADKVEVINFLGVGMGTFKFLNNSANINTNLFNSGSYFYRIFDKKNKVLTTGKFSVVK